MLVILLMVGYRKEPIASGSVNKTLQFFMKFDNV